jgi:hypothetical protein
MPLRNTRENYGSIARWLHWATALLFVAAYVAIYYRHWFTTARTPANARGPDPLPRRPPGARVRAAVDDHGLTAGKKGGEPMLAANGDRQNLAFAPT